MKQEHKKEKKTKEIENAFAKTERIDNTEVGKAKAHLSQQTIRTKDLRVDLEMYEIRRVLGNGSTGIVYNAVHKKLGRQVAIKMLRPEYFKSPVILNNFRKEARLISRIKHENVASVYDFMEINSHYYLIMEMVEGTNLFKRCQEMNLTEEEILHIMLGLLEGIRFTHNKQILHLDLKPSNVIINDFGEPVIIDFGISRFKEPETAKEKNAPVFGTPYYMAPEQYTLSLDMVDYRADIYSLGVVLYQPLSGQNYD